MAEQSGSLNEQPNRTDNVIAEKLAEKWRGRRVHLAGVFDGKQAALFVDGQLIGKAPPKFFPKQHRGKLFLGARFSGRMDGSGFQSLLAARLVADEFLKPDQRRRVDCSVSSFYRFRSQRQTQPAF